MRLFESLASALLVTSLAGAAAFAASPAPVPISVTASLAPSPVSSCPATANFAARIATTGPSEVQYHWLRSDGVVVLAKPIAFTSAQSETQTVTMTWTLATTTSGYVELVVDSPQKVTSNEATFVLTCGASSATLGDGSGSGSGGPGMAPHPQNNPTPDPVASRPGAGSGPAPTPTPFPLALHPPIGGPVHVSAQAKAVPQVLAAPCPLAVHFTGVLATANLLPNATTTVSYHWVRSDGVRSPEQTIAASANQSVTTTWTLDVSTSGSETLWIDAPNVTTSLPARFSLICPARGDAILNTNPS